MTSTSSTGDLVMRLREAARVLVDAEADDDWDPYWDLLRSMASDPGPIAKVLDHVADRGDDPLREVVADLVETGLFILTPAQQTVLLGWCRSESAPVAVSSIRCLMWRWDDDEVFQAATEMLLTRRRDHRPEVRTAVAEALGLCSHGTRRADATVTRALIELCADDDVTTSAEAVFSLAMMLQDDSVAIRDHLRSLLAVDDHMERALEGLARRHDPGVCELLLEHLGRDTIVTGVVSAAAALGDERLAASLEAWIDDFGYPDLLSTALQRCRPGRVGEEGRILTELIEGAAREGEELGARSDLFAVPGDGPLIFRVVDEFHDWAFDGLVERAGGSITAAVSLVMEDIRELAAGRQDSEPPTPGG